MLGAFAQVNVLIASLKDVPAENRTWFLQVSCRHARGRVSTEG